MKSRSTTPPLHVHVDESTPVHVHIKKGQKTPPSAKTQVGGGSPSSAPLQGQRKLTCLLWLLLDICASLTCLLWLLLLLLEASSLCAADLDIVRHRLKLGLVFRIPLVVVPQFSPVKTVLGDFAQNPAFVPRGGGRQILACSLP